MAVQVREKGTPDGDCVSWAVLARETLGAAVSLYVNRRFDIALEAGADGVHLPADGLPLARVRAATPRGFRVGISTHSSAEARRADLPARDEHAAEVLAIGGITEENLSRLEPYRDRIAGVAGIRLFQESPDPRAVADRIALR